jgi:YhcN/YlaJ family sporulation lipoprotein
LLLFYIYVIYYTIIFLKGGLYLKTSKYIPLLFITLLIGLSLITAGCSSYTKKPTLPTSNTQEPSTTVTPDNSTAAPNATSPAPTYPTEVANRAATEANKVTGVNKATAIVSGKTIFVGLDLKANIDKQKSAAIEKAVLDQVKKVESGYTVMVTSDIDTVTRIKNVAQGVAQGKPLSSFTNEITNITTRLTPKIK